MTLKFSPGNHRYWLDGKPIPGVTSLIKGGVPAPALMYWSAKSVAEWVADHPDECESLRSMGRYKMVAALKETPWEQRDTAAVRGTEVHALAERLVHGGEIDVPDHLTGFVEGYVRFLDAFQPAPVLTEKSVANVQHWYAGRFDLIADMGGARWMLDVKTAKGVYGDNALQVDAYRNAEFYVLDDDPDTHLPMPEGIERLGVLHVTDSGTELIPLDSTGDPFRVFLHAAFVAKKKDAIKAYVGDALPAPVREAVA